MVENAVSRLADDEIHVWGLDVDGSTAEVEAQAGVLSAEETARAKRFHFERDRKRFILQYTALRRLIGAYQGVDPARVVFQRGPHGKPALTEAFAAGDLRFNMSNSRTRALLAFTRHREIGVDIECSRPMSGAERIAQRFFSPGEYAALQRVPEGERTAAFFRCWTRKEAYVKGIGRGLSLGLDQFEVSFLPGQPAALLSTRHDPRQAERWTLHELLPGNGCMGALAVEGRVDRIACWEWRI